MNSLFWKAGKENCGTKNGNATKKLLTNAERYDNIVMFGSRG